MTAIEIHANIVTGRIEVQTGDWADDDPRWDAITRDGMRCDATEVEPWGEDETSMDRASEAVRDILGLEVAGWREDRILADVMVATVTVN